MYLIFERNQSWSVKCNRFFHFLKCAAPDHLVDINVLVRIIRRFRIRKVLVVAHPYLLLCNVSKLKMCKKDMVGNTLALSCLCKYNNDCAKSRRNGLRECLNRFCVLENSNQNGAFLCTTKAYVHFLDEVSQPCLS